MGERSEACTIGDEAKFARLSAGARPFSRGEQAAFLNNLRLAGDGDSEPTDRLALQIEVAANLENGVQDMRPRDPGPIWIVTPFIVEEKS